MKNDFNIRLLFVVMTVLIFLISLFVLRHTLQNKKPLKVHFLDVGQGDAIFITTVTGKQVLIDGGKYSDLDAKVSRYMPFYDRSLNLVVATHPDLDHIGGLASIIEHYNVDLFLHSGLLAGVSAYKALADAVITSSTDIVTAQAGQMIRLDKFTTMEVLAPLQGGYIQDANEHSVVLQIRYGDTSVLLTGDASLHNEHDLTDVYGGRLSSEILKLGHHGSRTSTSSIFLDIVKPEHAIVSAACGNQFGHPHPQVVQRVEERSIEIHNTCDHGDIVFESEGKQWKVR